VPDNTCWLVDRHMSSIICPKCGPTHVRNIWDEAATPWRFECVQCGAKGTTRFQPMRFEFDQLPPTKEPVSE